MTQTIKDEPEDGKDIGNEEEFDESSILSLSNEDLQKAEKGQEIEKKVEDSKEDEKDKAEKVDAKDTKKEDDKKGDDKKEKDPEVDEEGNVKIKKEDYDKLKKRIDDKDAHIKNIEQDNFKLREKKRERVTELEDKVKTLEAELEEAWVVGGTEAAAALKKVEGAKTELSAAKTEEVQAGNKSVIDKFAPNYESLISDMTEMLKSDGAEDRIVEQFAKTPYMLDPGTAVNLAKRVELSKDLIKSNDRIVELEKEIETLKKKPGKILDEIEKNTNKGKKMTGSTGGGKVDGHDIIPTSIYSMTSEQLREAEKGK